MGVPILIALFLQAAGSCNSAGRSIAVLPSTPVAERRQAYEQSIRDCPNDLELYIGYVSLLISGRDYSSALDWIAKGLAIAPGNQDLLLRQAAILRALGDPEPQGAAPGVRWAQRGADPLRIRPVEVGDPAHRRR